MAGIDLFERMLRSKIAWRLIIGALYIVFSVYEWKRHPFGVGFWLAVTCAVLSVYIFWLEIIERIRKSHSDLVPIQPKE